MSQGLTGFCCGTITYHNYYINFVCAFDALTYNIELGHNFIENSVQVNLFIHIGQCLIITRSKSFELFVNENVVNLRRNNKITYCKYYNTKCGHNPLNKPSHAPYSITTSC